MSLQKCVVFVILLSLLVPALPATAQDDPHFPIAYGETITLDMPESDRMYLDFQGQAGDVVLATARGAAFEGLYGQIGNRDTGWTTSSHTTKADEPMILIGLLPADREYSFTVGTPSNERGEVTITLERVGSRTASSGRTLAYGETVGATLGAEPLHAWWFEGRAGDMMELAVTLPQTSSAGVLLRLFDPAGYEVTPAKESEISFGSTLYVQRKFARLPVTGTYIAQLLRQPHSNEVEPFNYLIRVAVPTVTPLEYGQVHNGQLDLSVDTAYFIFEGAAGDTVFIDLQGDDDLAYRLSAPADPIFVDGGYSHRWILLDGGPFVVGVYHNSRTPKSVGPFTLAISRESTASITPIAYGETIQVPLSGTVAPLLQFEGRAGDLVQIEVPSRAFISRTAVGGPGVYAEDDYSGPLAGSLIPALRLPADGTYTILPHNYNGADFGSGLSIPVILSQVNPAPDIAYGGTLSATLSAGRVAQHVFEGQAGDQASIVLQSDSFTPDVYLFGPSGLVSSGVFWRSRRAALIPAALLPEDGLYTVVVDNFDSVAGAYTLSLDNGLASSATLLSYGDRVDGSLQAGDLDIYQFEAAAGDSIRVNCPRELMCEVYGPRYLYRGAVSGMSTRVLDSGIYTISLMEWNATPTTYDLSLSGSSFPAADVVDTDGDGLTDNVDRCPSELGPLDGCPATDRDGDGVLDLYDACPDTPGTLNGCPDSDGDSVIDDQDLCPDEPGSITAQGCPDADGDGVPDSEDKCPDVPGLAQFAGCPDADGDGVPDSEDECPDVPGLAELNGCAFYGRVAGNTNLRGGPGTNFDIVGTITPADDILILGRNEAGDWLYVRVDTRDAWLFASLVTTDADIAALPVVE